METAVLDACVLFKSGVRDFLLWVAEAGAFSPVWSDEIHNEWTRNRHECYGDSLADIIRTRTMMEQAFPGANFEPDPDVLKTIQLPDPNDVHVVATAVAAEADTIVTYNEKDFPDKILASLGLRKENPDAFCLRLFPDLQPEFIEGARLHRASLKRPPFDPDQYLSHVETQFQLAATAALLRSFRNDI
jgi:predicted nucleic acid-binding protein